jgi:hypothetical protein
MMQTKFGSEAWKTIRFAIRKWDRTFRLLIVLVVMSTMATMSVLASYMLWKTFT